MSEKPFAYDENDDSSQEEIEIEPDTLLKLLSRVSGPLKHVEEVEFPEPISSISKSRIDKQKISNRGRKSSEKWLTEIRRTWRYIDEEDKLSESWLAKLPQIQNLAASRYGGKELGRGLALQEVLRKAIIEAQKYSANQKIQGVLAKYPRVKMKEIAGQFGLISREHFSRNYGRKAAVLVVRAFQLLLAQPM
jgi:hypothetical protein